MLCDLNFLTDIINHNDNDRKNEPEIWNGNSDNNSSSSAVNISNNKIDDVNNNNAQNIFFNKSSNDSCIEKKSNITTSNSLNFIKTYFKSYDSSLFKNVFTKSGICYSPVSFVFDLHKAFFTKRCMTRKAKSLIQSKNNE